MSELIRPSTILPALRTPITIKTSDGLDLIGEVASPEGEISSSLLMLHPNPSGGGMMDSHIYKKAANRLPAMAGIQIIRFNTRGTSSEAGKSEGEFDQGKSEKLDVLAAINYCFDQLKVKDLYLIGWSFGTELALQYGRDTRLKQLILLSPPMLSTTDEDLKFWAKDGRPITALIPEYDDYLKPEQAKIRFSNLPNLKQINIDGAKHLWVGEPMVYLVLSEIVKIIAPSRLPLPTEI
ncbi:MAG: alpha/beta fold hydrolase [Candidatus Nanopelagicus sp.]|nr:alpha/beta fold hydrolase [Candidatus Nanopelagicus sp.]